MHHTPALELGDREISPWFHHKASLPSLVCECVNTEQCETMCACVCAYTYTGDTGKKSESQHDVFAGFINLDTIGIWGQIILDMGLSCTLWGI